MLSKEIKARAKINLALDVLSKRSDGYHELRMIMQTVELHDNVQIELTNGGVEVTSNSRWAPSGIDNIAYKAASILIDTYKIKSGVRIKIDKKIPVAAGLAGGSADAAAVLKGMNELLELGISQPELMVLGKSIGADVPYCISGRTMLAEGIGEILTELGPFSDVDIVLVKPKLGVSTAWVFKNLVLENIEERPDFSLLINSIENKDAYAVGNNMKNVLETVTVPKHGIINEIKSALKQHGACGSMMSGSGPTVFGIFPDRSSAQHAFNCLKSVKWDCFLTKTTNEGN